MNCDNVEAATGLRRPQNDSQQLPGSTGGGTVRQRPVRKLQGEGGSRSFLCICMWAHEAVSNNGVHAQAARPSVSSLSMLPCCVHLVSYAAVHGPVHRP